MDLMYITKPSILATLKILSSKERTEGVGDKHFKMKYEELRRKPPDWQA